MDVKTAVQPLGRFACKIEDEIYSLVIGEPGVRKFLAGEAYPVPLNPPPYCPLFAIGPKMKGERIFELSFQYIRGSDARIFGAEERGVESFNNVIKFSPDPNNISWEMQEDDKGNKYLVGPVIGSINHGYYVRELKPLDLDGVSGVYEVSETEKTRKKSPVKQGSGFISRMTNDERGFLSDGNTDNIINLKRT